MLSGRLARIAGSDLSEALVLDGRLHAPQERVDHKGEKHSTQRAPLEDTAKDPECQLCHPFAGSVSSVVRAHTFDDVDEAQWRL